MLQTILKRYLRPLCVPLIRTYLRRTTRGTEPVPAIAGHLYSLVQGAQFDYETTTSFGVRMSGNTRDLIQRCIYWFGVWEPDLTDFIGERLTEGDTFVDVGANIGYFSLYASKLVGSTGRVISVEASPGIFRQLQGNLARNRVSNTRPVNVAAADSRQKLRLFRAPETNSGQSSVLQADGFSLECEIDALPLGEILSRDEMASARMIKIDVEGAEWMVISGMQAVLAASRTDLEIVVEINPPALAQFGKSVDDLFTFFGSYGFHPYRLENDYSPARYLQGHRKTRPMRIREGLVEQTDVVFSRIDGAAL